MSILAAMSAWSTRSRRSVKNDAQANRDADRLPLRPSVTRAGASAPPASATAARHGANGSSSSRSACTLERSSPRTARRHVGTPATMGRPRSSNDLGPGPSPSRNHDAGMSSPASMASKNQSRGCPERPSRTRRSDWCFMPRSTAAPFTLPQYRWMTSLVRVARESGIPVDKVRRFPHTSVS